MAPSYALAFRKGAAKRWQGYVQAGLLSRVMHVVRGADVVSSAEGNTLGSGSASCPGPRAVEEPGHVRKLHAREPGDPVLARPDDHRVGRPGNAKAVSLGCTDTGSRMGA
jgi:hypothetical protein